MVWDAIALCACSECKRVSQRHRAPFLHGPDGLYAPPYRCCRTIRASRATRCTPRLLSSGTQNVWIMPDVYTPGHSHAHALRLRPSTSSHHAQAPTSPIAFPIQSVVILPVSLEKVPAGHAQQTASDDRVAPATTHSARDKYTGSCSCSAREGKPAIVQEAEDDVYFNLLKNMLVQFIEECTPSKFKL
jgi:hypothetical protein